MKMHFLFYLVLYQDFNRLVNQDIQFIPKNIVTKNDKLQLCVMYMYMD